MTALVEVRNLVRWYEPGGLNAVDGISFDIDRGEMFALLGPTCWCGGQRLRDAVATGVVVSLSSCATIVRIDNPCGSSLSPMVVLIRSGEDPRDTISGGGYAERDVEDHVDATECS